MDEIWDVVGYRVVSFKDESGRMVNGYNLYLTRPGDPDKMSGTECQKLFISSQYVKYGPVVGDTVQLFFNRYGKVSSIAKI